MDSEGPWFDDVVYLQEKEPDDVFVASTKSQSFGIVGGGMSGLMTGHLLDSVGIHNWTIIEASSRIGGRVHTTYLNNTRPDQYQYQEMGPMRFPLSITYGNPPQTIKLKDHRMVFQLADVLNDQNKNAAQYKVNFIKWYERSPSDPADTSAKRPDGTTPSVAEVDSDPAYATNLNLTYSNPTAVALAKGTYNTWISANSYQSIADNVYKAHQWAVENGYFHFSEAGYMKYQLRFTNNITDEADDISDNIPA